VCRERIKECSKILRCVTLCHQRLEKKILLCVLNITAAIAMANSSSGRQSDLSIFFFCTLLSNFVLFSSLNVYSGHFCSLRKHTRRRQ